MRDTDTEALDQSDMEILAAGRDVALNRLMDRHAATVYHFLLRMLGNDYDAQDLAQETFVRVYEARERFKRGQSFRSWIYTIAANLARNHVRWRTRHPEVPLESPERDAKPSWDAHLPSPGNDPGQEALRSEKAEAVRQAIVGLPPDLREAIVLCEWEDRSLSEAASILNTTPKAIESRLYRARKLLRDRLKRWL